MNIVIIIQIHLEVKWQFKRDESPLANNGNLDLFIGMSIKQK